VAFDPLQTDEKLEKPIKSGPNFEAQILSGCSFFVATSLLTYAIGVWPFFVLADQHLIAKFLMACAFGLLPTAIIGVVAGIKGGVPGACGFLGGTIAVAMFMYLRISQIMLGEHMPDLPKPDYPSAAAWILPLFWTVIAVIIAGFSAQKGEREHSKKLEMNR